MSTKNPVEAINQRIGRNIRTLRLLQGFTQEYVGERLVPAISPQQILNYEKGNDKIPAYRLVQIMALLGCRLDQVFEGVSEHLPSGNTQAITAKEGQLIKSYRAIEDPALRDLVSEMVSTCALVVSGRLTVAKPH